MSGGFYEDLTLLRSRFAFGCLSLRAYIWKDDHQSLRRFKSPGVFKSPAVRMKFVPDDLLLLLLLLVRVLVHVLKE